MRGLTRAVCAVLALVSAASAAPRPFPDTRDRIRVYADQLPSQLTDAQWRFVATHYVGSQKMPRSWTRHVRRLNPNFLMLHYQLAVGLGPAPFLVGDRWVSDWPQVTRHEDWFLHDTAGHRLRQTAWNWDVADIRFSGTTPRTGYPAYWLTAAVARMRQNEDDGCFADSYTEDILTNQTQPPAPLFTDVAAIQRDWLPSLNRYGALCAREFQAQPERFYFLPNLGGLVTTWDKTTDLSVGDGGMNEGFCTGGSLADWTLEMTRVLQLAAAGKIVLCQTGIDPSEADRRWFIVGSYLLTKGRHSYLNMMHHSSLEWYPEYDLNLGASREEPKPDVAGYWDQVWHLYRRDFTRGMVLVNPSASPVWVVSLGGPYQLLSASGGGPVGSDGKTTGSLALEAVTGVTVPAHSARVLLK